MAGICFLFFDLFLFFTFTERGQREKKRIYTEQTKTKTRWTPLNEKVGKGVGAGRVRGGEGSEGGDTLTSHLVRKSEKNTYPAPHLLVDSLPGQRHQLLESKD